MTFLYKIIATLGETDMTDILVILPGHPSSAHLLESASRGSETRSNSGAEEDGFSVHSEPVPSESTIEAQIKTLKEADAERKYYHRIGRTIANVWGTIPDTIKKEIAIGLGITVATLSATMVYAFSWELADPDNTTINPFGDDPNSEALIFNIIAGTAIALVSGGFVGIQNIFTFSTPFRTGTDPVQKFTEVPVANEPSEEVGKRQYLTPNGDRFDPVKSLEKKSPQHTSLSVHDKQTIIDLKNHIKNLSWGENDRKASLKKVLISLIKTIEILSEYPLALKHTIHDIIEHLPIPIKLAWHRIFEPVLLSVGSAGLANLLVWSLNGINNDNGLGPDDFTKLSLAILSGLNISRLLSRLFGPSGGTLSQSILHDLEYKNSTGDVHQTINSKWSNITVSSTLGISSFALSYLLINSFDNDGFNYTGFILAVSMLIANSRHLSATFGITTGKYIKEIFKSMTACSYIINKCFGQGGYQLAAGDNV